VHSSTDSQIAFVTNGGPTAIAFDRSGSFLYAPLQNQNSIGRLSVSGDGKLGELGTMALMQDESAAQPVAVVFSGSSGPTRAFTLNAAANTIDSWGLCYSGSALNSHQVRRARHRH